MLDVLDQPGSSNGATATINVRLEHLRSTTLGSRKLTHCITRTLLNASRSRTNLHPLP